jgi:hypothetical protein
MADPVWVDDITPLNAANMNKLQTRDEKAQINGYPSLDSSGRIPIAQLPESGIGAELTYEGDYASATTYQDGDVVVKDGVAYLCVGGPTTVAPDIAPWGAGGQPLPPVVNGKWLKGVGGAAVWSDIDDASLPARIRQYSVLVSDWNTATTSGWYSSNPGATNAPHASPYLIGIYSAFNNVTGYQEVWEVGAIAGSRRQWRREYWGGTWYAWRLLDGGELAYAEVQTLFTIGTSDTDPLITAPAFTTLSGETILVEFFAPTVGTPAAVGQWIVGHLKEGTTDLGRMFDISTPSASILTTTVSAKRKLTLAAGSHTLRMIAAAGTASGTIGAQPWHVPMFLRVTRA